SLQASHGDIVDVRFQVPYVEMKSAHFNARASIIFNVAHNITEHPTVGQACADDPHDSKTRQNREQQRGARPVFPAELHDPFPSDTTSMRRRPRVSSNHFVALSLMDR